MKQCRNNAYIDGANLHLGVSSANWKLDYKKFRIWLTDKFQINDAFIFLGNISEYSSMYNHFISCGFKIIFKPVVYDRQGKAKGNCDADLVLHAVSDFYENKYDKMLLVSSDGDYASLVDFANRAGRSLGILSPSNAKRCSFLLKRTDAKIFYMSDQKHLLQK